MMRAETRHILKNQGGAPICVERSEQAPALQIRHHYGGPSDSRGNVRSRSRAIAVVILVAWSGDSRALAVGSGENTDSIVPILLALIAILAVAKLGGELFERIGQPAVLGELLGGVALGNLALLNQSWNFFAPLQPADVQEPWAIVIRSLAHLGVIILLFEVGLESTVTDMLKVGASSFVVAVLGVIAPSVLGIGVSWLFIKELPEQITALAGPGFSLWYVHIFVGATLSATSVGITARVLKDLGNSGTRNPRSFWRPPSSTTFWG